MDNGIYTVSGYGAAKILAEVKTPFVRPGGKRIDPFPTVSWENASEEMKNDHTRIGIKEKGKLKTFRSHTIEEKKEINLNKAWRIEQIFLYLLNCNFDYAKKYMEENKKDIEKLGIKLDLNVPRCQFNEDNQCNLFCYFYEKGKCLWKG